MRDFDPIDRVILLVCLLALVYFMWQVARAGIQ